VVEIVRREFEGGGKEGFERDEETIVGEVEEEVGEFIIQRCSESVRSPNASIS